MCFIEFPNLVAMNRKYHDCNVADLGVGGLEHSASWVLHSESEAS